jgi:MFS family permease
MWYAASVIVRSPLDSLIHSVFITGVAIALFTPTIVHDLGYSANNAQLLSIPPFFLAGVSTYIASMWSDRLNLRGPFIAAGSLFSMIGYIIAYTTNSPGAGYAAAIIAACGSFPCIAISVAWAGGNAGGNMKRGIVLALVVGLGSVGGCVFLLGCREAWELIARMTHCSVCSSFIYYQPPRFYKGHGTMIGCLCMRYKLPQSSRAKMLSFPVQYRLQLHHDVDV